MKSLKISNQLNIIGLIVAIMLVMSACSVVNGQTAAPTKTAQPETLTEVPSETDSNENPITQLPADIHSVEDVLGNIYEQVNPSVVNIQVARDVPSSEVPFAIPEGQEAPLQQSLGSGFVWDSEGHIVTNNHVVEGASIVDVVLSNGLSYQAEIIGTDPDSDLAVVQIDAPTEELRPVTVADSTQVQVGDVAIAIGNPYGLEGTMTMGIISALGRSLPVQNTGLGGTYSIPDIIQTDTAINPGNSGGVLLNISGEVIGVTTAIESPVRASTGVGFVVPSAIVNNIVPVLIEDGEFDHSWLGISGGTLPPDIAEAMGLERDQRGILVGRVVEGGPADEAGIQGSTEEYEYRNTTILIGGDVITAIDNNPTERFEDLVSYLARATRPGNEVTLEIIRDGEMMQVDVTLEARPDQQERASTNAFASGQAYLGITGGSLVPEIAEEMGLGPDQEGVLIVQIANDSPADDAGLQGSFMPFEIEGQTIMIGGDVITEYNGQPIDGILSLRERLAESEPGDEITLTIIRDGETIEVDVTLEELPS